MCTTKTNDFNEILLERRSVKEYDPSVKISKEEMTKILEDATRAPSSTNYQPWRLVVIESDEAKAKFAEIAPFNKSKIESASAVIAILADRENGKLADEIYSANVPLGYMTTELKDQFLAISLDYYNSLSKDERRDIMMADCGLFAMQFMLVARAHGYDTNPMGGFDKSKIAELFDYDKDRYVAVMAITIGKAANPGFPTARLPINHIAKWK